MGIVRWIAALIVAYKGLRSDGNNNASQQKRQLDRVTAPSRKTQLEARFCWYLIWKQFGTFHAGMTALFQGSLTCYSDEEMLSHTV